MDVFTQYCSFDFFLESSYSHKAWIAWLFELAGGALLDYENTCIPKSQREASFNIAALHQWDMGNVDDRCKAAAEEWISGTLLPVNCGGPYPCVRFPSCAVLNRNIYRSLQFLGRQEPPARVMACFGENWARLKELKQKYDPDGMFRNTFWPLDAQGQIHEPEAHEPPSP